MTLTRPPLKKTPTQRSKRPAAGRKRKASPYELGIDLFGEEPREGEKGFDIALNSSKMLRKLLQHRQG